MTVRLVCAAVLAAGVGAELTTTTGLWLRTSDYAVGAAVASAAIWLSERRRPHVTLILALALAWFAGTASLELSGYGGDVAVLAWRGVLVQLVIVTLALPTLRARPLVVGGYAAVLIPAPYAGPASAAVMVLCAAGGWRVTRRAPSSERPLLGAIGAIAAAVSLVWALAPTLTDEGATAPLLDDLLVLVLTLALAAVSSRELGLRRAISSIVVELGPSSQARAPVSTLLREALADPGLEIRYRVPGLGWFDDEGTPVVPPPVDGSVRVTRVTAPVGGEVALIHGSNGGAGAALSQAAATAAAVAMDSVRIGAQIRENASAVRHSRRRLLRARDTERQVLEAQLRAGPAGRLQQIDEVLSMLETVDAEPIRAELAVVLEDLARVARGLYPINVSRMSLQESLESLARGSKLPLRISVVGAEGLPEEFRALTYFFCSECLANVSRHSRASTVVVEVQIVDRLLVLGVLDDGVGGASLAGARGLRGLADRVEVYSGTLTVSSPLGGPTRIGAEIPLP